MILFQKKDAKYTHLRQELLKNEIHSEAVKCSPILAPLTLINTIRKHPHRIYVFRYLNDYKSLLKTLFRLISEFLLVSICRYTKTTVWWLCHNVDKESETNFPWITNLRRSMVVRRCSNILVTNKLLVPYARAQFPGKEVEWISLGYMKGKIYDDINEERVFIENLEKWLTAKKDNKTKIIFCAGTMAKKSLHFERIHSLIEKLNNSDSKYKWLAVVIGAPVKASSFIFNIPIKVYIDQEMILKYVDFYYRVINDLSISYTIYEAAENQIPIITEEYGILPSIVRHYNLGFVIDQQILKENHLTKISFYGFEAFTKENNWRNSSYKIAKLYFKDLNRYNEY